MKDKIKVGITMGDPSGIGPEITLKAIRALKGLADFTIIGDNGVFEKSRFTVCGSYAAGNNIKFIDLRNVSAKNFEFGKIKPEYARASIEYLDKALELIKNKKIDCLVTCPISKEALSLAGFSYSGHTEYLAQATNTKNTVMMLLNKKLRISIVTRHVPLKMVSRLINEEKIYKTVLASFTALIKLFSIKNPRVVVCGLNPHASDNGVIGKEENKIIKPAVMKIKNDVKTIDGPMSADTAIFKANKGDYDCVIAMYHDQALIPLKLLGQRGVNLTLGLPFIRTSPLHGTAFDIAKTNSANPSSLIAALKLAVKCIQNLKKD